MASQGAADADQPRGDIQRRRNNAAVQNTLRPVANHHRLIIKAELGKLFFIPFQFQPKGTVKRHVINKNLAHQL
ncbi:hypothetical protein UA44_07680 [Klebsiella aerogenes]|nr:hypothetical protein UA44_07680 [Klebsiella aerogenes]